MKKGFTLVELLAAIVIVLAILGLVIGAIVGGSGDDRDWDATLNPERAKARALQEANDLKREELELRRMELQRDR